MKYTILPLLLINLFLSACDTSTSSSSEEESDSLAIVDATKEWKLGVALWTFHTFNFPDALSMVDSAGLVYIEPNTFHKSGPQLKDSTISQLSPAGIEKLKTLISQKGLKAESIYIVGDSTILSWKKQFDIARQFGVQFVTTEPPLDMWDSIDSLAGAYGIKVAIHEHWKGVSHYWNPDTLLMALKGHPNFGACADLGHWPKSGIDPVEALRKLTGNVISIHLKDIAAKNDPTLKDVTVGTGILDFPAIFEELRAQKFKGHLYIERDAEDKPSNLPSVLKTVTFYNDATGKLK